jgi:AAA domain
MTTIHEDEELIRSLGGIICGCSPETNGHVTMTLAPAAVCTYCGYEGPLYQQALRAKMASDPEFNGLTGINDLEYPDQDEPVPYHLTNKGVREAKFRFTSGSCLLSAPKVPPSVWGRDSDILWAEGQSLIIAGHDGTGKTTVAGNLVRARLGVTKEVLGLPVVPGRKNILYFAMDRPMQAKSNLARMFSEDDAEILKKLIFWDGPPPEDFSRNTKLLTEMCLAADADTAIIDSLKDACVPISDDAVGAGWNRARQEALVNGIQVLELHHPRKPSGEQSVDKVPELADLYGSRWIAAGAGSVIILHGRPGDPVIGVHNRKPVMNVVGTGKMEIGEDGTVHLDEPLDILKAISSKGTAGITAPEAAQFLYGSAGRNEVVRAKRILENKIKDELLWATEGGGRGNEKRWYLLAHEMAA